MDTTTTTTSTTRSTTKGRGRLVLVLVVLLALLAGACGSSDDSTESGSDAGDRSLAPAEGGDGAATGDFDGESDDATAEPVAAGESSGDDSGEEDGGDAASVAPSGGATEATAEADSADAEAPADRSASDDLAEESVVEPSTTTIPQEQPRAGLLTAGDVDDNLNFDFFAGYLGRVQQDYGQTLPQLTIDDRIVIDVIGANGVGLANARLDIEGDGRSTTIYTDSSGRAYFFPAVSGLRNPGQLSVTVTEAGGQNSEVFPIDASNSQDLTVTMEAATLNGAPPAALDIALVIDVTGSMGDELSYLTTEFTSIVAQLDDDFPQVDMRYGLVVYRDDGDEFVTRVFDFTSSPAEMQANLADQVANGGGDYPEALDTAVIEATQLSWRDGDVSRVMIVNADAPPHDDGFQRALDATTTARQSGIRIYPLAASGVGDTAEYLMRLMAVTTGGRHLFLTDDSGIGLSHQEPKVQCYVVTRLDQLLIRVLATEMGGGRLEPAPANIIRTVGNYDRGVCLDDGQ